MRTEIKSRHQTSRQFRRAQGHSSITEQTCFVLSSKGIGAALASVGGSANGQSAMSDRPVVPTSLPAKLVPMWEADRRLLTYDGRIVKRFKSRALNQETVLNAFQEENWPHRIS